MLIDEVMSGLTSKVEQLIHTAIIKMQNNDDSEAKLDLPYLTEIEADVPKLQPKSENDKVDQSETEAVQISSEKESVEGELQRIEKLKDEATFNAQVSHHYLKFNHNFCLGSIRGPLRLDYQTCQRKIDQRVKVGAGKYHQYR